MIQKMRKKMSEMLEARKENGNKGFTLVELIVVIVILAILIGVTIGGVYSYVNKSRVNTDINNAASIQSALATLSADKDMYSAAKSADLSTAVTITWSDAVAVNDIASKISGDFGTVDKAALGTKISSLLTEGLPESKAKGGFKIEIKDTSAKEGNIQVTCKAYKEAACTTAQEAEE